jgi:hypothetical protein
MIHPTRPGSLASTFVASLLAALLFLPALVEAQRLPISQQVRQQFVAVDAEVVALVNARVIDGTGAPAREGQTLLLRGGRIEAVGPSAELRIPEGAETVDLSGKTVLPGFVMLHEHLYYPTGPGHYANLSASFAPSTWPAESPRCAPAGT